MKNCFAKAIVLLTLFASFTASASQTLSCAAAGMKGYKVSGPESVASSEMSSMGVVVFEELKLGVMVGRVDYSKDEHTSLIQTGATLSALIQKTNADGELIGLPLSNLEVPVGTSQFSTEIKDGDANLKVECVIK